MINKLGLNRFAFGITAVTLILMVLQPLWLQGVPNWLAPTRFVFGGAILLTFLIAVANFLFLSKSMRVADYLITAFILLALLSGLWSEAPEVYIKGLRYTVFATLLYFVGRALPLEEWSWERILYWSLYLAGGLAVLQFGLWILGLEWLYELIRLGIQHFAGEWPRLQGSFAGPNQLATFLMIGSIWLFCRGRLKGLELVVAMVLVLLTFSRSAILGLLAGIAATSLAYNMKSVNAAKLVLVGVASALIILTIFIIEPIRQAFIEARHVDLRLEIYANAAVKFKEASFLNLLIGHGPGTAGPASFHLAEGFITENWFLQIVYEYGLAGLGLLLTAWILIVSESYKVNASAILALVVAVTVNSLFLHPLSDNALAALRFYLLLGLGYNLSNGKNRA